MLPKAHRLHRSRDFDAVVRGGVKKGRRLLVVHMSLDETGLSPGGPRFGLIVSRAVGNSVVRHRVSRRLRHICAPLINDLPESARVVIRALPRSAAAESSELDADVSSAISSLKPRVLETASAGRHAKVVN